MKKYYVSILIITFIFNIFADCKSAAEIDPTVKYQVEAQERMLDKQLEAQKEPSISKNTKKILIFTAVAFAAGGIGAWRKFTWVSDKMFKTNDYLRKTLKQMIHGETLKLSEQEIYDINTSIVKTNIKIDELKKKYGDIPTPKKIDPLKGKSNKLGQTGHHAFMFAKNAYQYIFDMPAFLQNHKYILETYAKYTHYNR